MSDIDWIALVLLVVHVALALTAALVVSANRKPSSAIAWILAVVFIPVLGILFFLLVGAGRLPRRRRDKQARGEQAILTSDRGCSTLVSHRERVAGLAAARSSA